MSPCPTLTALEWGPLTRPPHDRERDGWPIVDVIDRSDEEPWKRSLVTSAADPPPARPGTHAWCACTTPPGAHDCSPAGSAATLARCERCDAAVALDDDERLVLQALRTRRARRCAWCAAPAGSPTCDPACRVCARRSRPRPDRPGRAGDRRRAQPTPPAASRSTSAPRPRCTGSSTPTRSPSSTSTASCWRPGIEPASRRWRCSRGRPGWSARERGAGGSSSRRSCPTHPVVQAAVHADPGRLVDDERARRQMLGLPPFGAYAEISGAGSDEFVASLPVARRRRRRRRATSTTSPRAADWMTLGDASSAQGVRPPGSRLRIASTRRARARRRRSAQRSVPARVATARTAGPTRSGAIAIRPSMPCSTSQRCSESAPRCFCTTSTAAPSGASRAEPARAAARAAPACRSGSAGSTRSWRTARRPARRRARPTRTLVEAVARGVRGASARRARSLTSTAHTVAPGERSASVSAIAPAAAPEVEQVARRRRRRRLAQQQRRAGVEVSVAEHAAVGGHRERHVGQRRRRRSRVADATAGSLIEVVRHQQLA